MEDEDAEKVAEALNERYRTAYIAGAYRGDTEHIPQQMLMPDIKDPKLYLLKCIVSHSHGQGPLQYGIF